MSSATGTNSFAAGAGASSGGINQPIQANTFTNANTTAVGTAAQAGATGDLQAGATAIGNAALANAAEATALGHNAQATSANSIAIGGSTSGGAGNAAYAAGTNAIAIGSGAQATAANSVALGSGSIATAANTVSVGSTGVTRRITNVSDGAAAADVATYGQLVTTNSNVSANATRINTVGSGAASAIGGGASFDTTTGAFTSPSYVLNGSATAFTNVVSGIQAIASGAAGPVQFDTAGVPSNTLRLVGTGVTVTLTNVAAGTADTDAVNVSQLNAAVITAGNNVPFRASADGGAGTAPMVAATNSTAGGSDSNATYGATALGYGANAAGSQSIAMGLVSSANGNAATAIGYAARSTGEGAIAIGGDTTFQGPRENGGNAALASANFTTAIGTNATANLDNSVALGSGSVTTGASSITGNTINGVQFNAGAVAADSGDVVSVGAAGVARQIQNVAAGAVTATSTDAVNGSQLYSVATNVTAVGAGAAGALGGGAAYNAASGTFTGPTYTFQSGSQFTTVGSALTNLDDRTVTNANAIAGLQIGASGIVQQASASAPITVGAATGGTVVNVAGSAGNRQITGVAAGTLSATSTDAINGAQLYGVATNVTAVGAGAAGALGGGAAYLAASGTFTGPTYTFQSGSQFTTVGGALTNLDDRTVANANAIDGLQNGTSGIVQQASASAPITVGAATGGTVVNVAGSAGNRQITGVAAGTLSATSTDAVNGAQLFATNAQVATNTSNIATTNKRMANALGGGAGVDGNGLLMAPSYTVQGASYDNVGSALGALDAATSGNAQAIGTLQGQSGANAQSIADLQSGQSGPLRANNAGGFAAPQASGANAIAAGFGSVASGGSTTAIGTGARATEFGAVAIGSGAVASGDPSTAVGFNAAATGAEVSAFGAFASATADNSTALGRSATAGGTNAVAVGFGATAAQANSVAIGGGVQTTRANQIAIGNAGQTYTLAGIASAQSRASQNGATGFVTTDAAGNLASTSFGPVNIAALDGRVEALEAGFNGLSRYAVESRREARRGISAVAATAPVLMPSLPGKTTITVKAAGYRGEYGTGFTVAHRLDTALPAVLFGSYSNGSGREHVVAGGAGIEF